MFFKIPQIKDLMENIMNDWSLLKTEDEFEIIKKHSDFGRFYTVLFTCKKWFLIIFDISTLNFE